jgi:hypothetical protein
MILLLVTLILLSLAAPLVGADSRDGRDWTPTDPLLPGYTADGRPPAVSRARP